MEGKMEVKSLYLSRIRDCFPELVISNVEHNSEGLVNDIIIINRERVFRFPKDEWAKDDQRREIKILELVRQYVDMPVPVFDRVEEDFATYELIPGDALLRDDILRQSQGEQERLAQQLATFLQQLHSIPMEALRAQGLPHSVTARTRDDWLKLFDDVKGDLFSLLMKDSQEWVNRHFEPILNDEAFMSYRPALINGDLAPYHLLFDREQNVINGIIDFGTAGIGDPACDVGCLINHYGELFVRFLSRYYPAIGDMIERARFWAGTLELQWVLGGIRTGDLSWFVVHIGRARDVMPIGSGWDNGR